MGGQKRITYCELRCKEVINTADGSCLGRIIDLEINPCDGAILAIIVPGPARFLRFFRGGKEIVIPYCKICKIGDDVILVDIECVPALLD